jgi:predicted XRE-type DNA-binding protein
MTKPDKESITRSSGNVFADLKLENSEELQLKARLTHLINRTIHQRGWTQQKAAEVLKVKQPDVSALARGQRLDHYSVERLMQFLARLDNRVTITVSGAELPPEEFVITAQVTTDEPRAV